MGASRTRVFAVGTLLAAVLATPAAAATRDDGPYTPFPEGNPKHRAVDFVHRLNEQRVPAPARRQAGPIGEARLEKGTSLPDPDPDPGTTPESEKAQPKTAFGRAGVTTTDGDPKAATLPFALLALLLAGAAIWFERRARRRRPAGV